MKQTLKRTESLSAAIMMISWLIFSVTVFLINTASVIISASQAGVASADAVIPVVISSFTTNILSWAGCVLLIIAMFRGKRNVFAGVAFGVNAVFAAVSFFSAIINGNFAYAPFLTAALLAVLAVDCFMNGKFAKYAGVFLIFSVLVAVLNVVSGVQSAIKMVNQMGIDSSDMAMRITGLLPFLMSTIVSFGLYVSYVCAAASFMEEKTVQVACADGSVRHIPVSVTHDEGFFGMLAHVLLLLFAGGIWSLVWLYRTTKYLNKTPDEPNSNPLVQTILFAIVPFYSIYWFYQQGKRIDKLGQSCGINASDAMACLLLGIFLPFAAILLIQSRINNISKACAAPVF